MAARLEFLDALLLECKPAYGLINSGLLILGIVSTIICTILFIWSVWEGDVETSLYCFGVMVAYIALMAVIIRYGSYRRVTVLMPEDTPAYKIQQMSFTVLKQDGNQWILRDNGEL